MGNGDTGYTGSTGDTGSTGSTGDTGSNGSNSTQSKPQPSGPTNVNNWVTFIKTLLIYFCITLLFGVFGSNFIYLTTRGSDLDIIFPTDDNFYSNKKYKVSKPGAYHMDGCHEIPSDASAFFENNFPYNFINPQAVTKEQLEKLSFIQRATNWFARTCAGCFKSNRALIKAWLNNFTPHNDNPLSNNTFQILIAAPFTVLISFVGGITGFFTSIGAAAAADMKITVWGGFLLYAWGLCFGLGFIIFLRLVGTLLLYGMSENWKEISNIMACNVKTMVVLFGFFACGSAYDTLDPTIAGIMGVVYLLLVGWTIWKSFMGGKVV